MTDFRVAMHLGRTNGLSLLKGSCTIIWKDGTYFRERMGNTWHSRDR